MRNIKLLRVYLFTGCCITVLLSLVYYFFVTYKHIKDWTNERSKSTSLSESQTDVGISNQQKRDHLVLIYQPRDFSPTVQSGYRPFYTCPVSNCFLTRSESHVFLADVIFFGENSDWSLPAPRPPNQIWIMRLLESPENTVSMKNFENEVNYTASYLRSSDIPAPYGVFRPYQRAVSQDTLNFAKGKKGLVAWFVSHCFTNNNRMRYARLLQNYIQVDIFGKCGKRSISNVDGNALLKNHYKFYLAFENSNCKEYITEKFWQKSLGNNVIPVVMGATKEEYELVAPPHSFIHVDDFKTVAALAEYLHHLDQDDDLYNSYFEWKNYGRVRDSGFYCNLCAFVQFPSPKKYSNIDEWWKREGKCQETFHKNHTK